MPLALWMKNGKNELLTYRTASMPGKALEQLFTVGALTEVQKRRFRLHVFQGLSTRQIGRMEGTSHQAVAKSINLAIAKLKKYFAAQG